MSVTLTKTAPTAPTGAHDADAVYSGGAAVDADAIDAVEDRVPVGPGWRALSDAFAEEAPMIADRDDLLVTIAPGAGHGAPACLLPAEAMIEIDGVHLGALDPATLRPDHAEDRARYGPVWGLFVHECAHGRHTVWDPPVDAPPGAVAAAVLLEESRIEAAQILARPDDRHWLRASATALILADAATVAPDAGADPDESRAMTRAMAARSAALLLAREDAGVLAADEVMWVAAAVTRVLGADTVAALRGVWRDAHTAPAAEPAALAETMIALGRRWCAAVGTDPDIPDDTPPPHTAGTGSGTPASGGGSDAPDAPDASDAADGDPDPLARDVVDAVTRAARVIAAHVEGEEPPLDPEAVRRQEEAAERAAADRVASTARSVFTGRPGARVSAATGSTGTAGTRAPTPAEQRAARLVGRSLSTAGIPDKVTTRTTSVIPPGRLRMRGARAADAQRAAGAPVTAEPFVRTHRATVPAPPLRLGIACDVSGSMRAFAAPVASAAWILATATRHTLVPATSATVIFGARVRPIVHPGTHPAQVTEFHADDGTEVPSKAIDALDGALHLSRPGAARLLVIVSDGDYYLDGERERAQTRVDRLRGSGAAVLWIAPGGWATPLHGVTTLTLDDPTATARAIAHAATTALRAADR